MKNTSLLTLGLALSGLLLGLTTAVAQADPLDGGAKDDAARAAQNQDGVGGQEAKRRNVFKGSKGRTKITSRRTNRRGEALQPPPGAERAGCGSYFYTPSLPGRNPSGERCYESSASGCRSVTGHWTYKSKFGFKQYTYYNKFSWCWNRAKKQVFNIGSNWGYSDPAETVRWDKQAYHQIGRYKAEGSSGRKSAGGSNRRGQFISVLPGVGETGVSSPRVDIRGYWNGQWRYAAGTKH